MHEGVETCEIIAPRISEKLVIGEEKDAKYELSINVGNMKSGEDAMLPSPIVQQEIDGDNAVIPIKPANEQNGCHFPNLLKEGLEQNNVPPIVHSDETKDNNTSCSLVETDSLEEELLITEVVEDFCDQPNNTALDEFNDNGNREALEEEDEFNEQQVVSHFTYVETKVAEEKAKTDHDNAPKSTSDVEKLETVPVEDIVDQEESIVGSLTEEFDVTETETECNEESLSVTSVNQELKTEHPENGRTILDAQKEEITTSSNQNLEEADAIPFAKEDLENNEVSPLAEENVEVIPSAKEDDSAEEDGEVIPPAEEDDEVIAAAKEDEEDNSAEREECECAGSNNKAECVFDDDETSNSEDEENSSSCRAMKAREYYSYYQRYKKKELYSMYPLGKVMLPRGFLLHFRASTRREIIHMKREYIRDALLPLGAEIAFIDYQRGQLCGWVRFQESCPAIKILKQMENNTILIKTVYMEFSKVPKKEEVKYLNKAGKEMSKLRKKKVCLDKKIKLKKKKIIKHSQLNDTEVK